LVPAAAERARGVPFVAFVVGLLIAGLVGLLVLNTSLQRGVYAVTDLRAQAADLTLRQQNLQLKEAVAIGMVRTASPAFLSLRTGKVLGVPTPGRRGDQVLLGESVSNVKSSPKATPLWAGTRNSGHTDIQHLPGPDRQRVSDAKAATRNTQ
jgi:hypothetical protein